MTRLILERACCSKLLPKLKQKGNRALIFGQMVKMLDILEDYLIRKQYPFERIDGSIRGNLRQDSIDGYYSGLALAHCHELNAAASFERA